MEAGRESQLPEANGLVAGQQGENGKGEEETIGESTEERESDLDASEDDEEEDEDEEESSGKAPKRGLNYIFEAGMNTLPTCLFSSCQEMDDEDCERRRGECLDEMLDLEKQFQELKEK